MVEKQGVQPGTMLAPEASRRCLKESSAHSGSFFPLASQESAREQNISTGSVHGNDLSAAARSEISMALADTGSLAEFCQGKQMLDEVFH